MNKGFFGLALVGSLVACSSGASTEPTAGSGRLRIEVACGQDSDCPNGFECESENEHGTTKSFCESREEAQPDGSGAQCPAGYELEVEHAQSFCKPHGGDGGEGGRDAGHDGAEDIGHDGGHHEGHDEVGDDDKGGAAGEAGDDKGHGAGEAGDDNGHDGSGHG